MAEHTHIIVDRRDLPPGAGGQPGAPRRYAAYQVLAAPAWLQRPPQRDLLRSQGDVKDDHAATLISALRLRLLSNMGGAVLDLYGAGLGLPRLPNELDADYKLRLADVFATYRYAGTFKGLTDVLELRGYRADIRFLRDTDPNRWAEFTVYLSPTTGAPYSFDLDQLIRGLIRRFKAAHARLAALRIGRPASDCPRYSSGVTYNSGAVYCAPDPAYPRYNAARRYGDGAQYLDRTQVYGG